MHELIFSVIVISIFFHCFFFCVCVCVFVLQVAPTPGTPAPPPTPPPTIQPTVIVPGNNKPVATFAPVEVGDRISAGAIAAIALFLLTLALGLIGWFCFFRRTAFTLGVSVGLAMAPAAPASVRTPLTLFSDNPLRHEKKQLFFFRFY